MRRTSSANVYNFIREPSLTTADNPTTSKPSALRKASLFYLVSVMFSYTTGGPFGLEDMVTTSGPGLTLFICLPCRFSGASRCRWCQQN
jgi:hypothetical protein